MRDLGTNGDKIPASLMFPGLAGIPARGRFVPRRPLKNGPGPCFPWARGLSPHGDKNGDKRGTKRPRPSDSSGNCALVLYSSQNCALFRHNFPGCQNLPAIRAFHLPLSVNLFFPPLIFFGFPGSCPYCWNCVCQGRFLSF